MRDSSVHADAKLLKALGAVTIDFSMLDAALQLAISFMMMPDVPDIVGALDAAARNMILTSEMSFKQRVYAFASLYRYRWPHKVNDEFEALCKRLHESEDRRNQLVHSSYVADGERSRTLRRKSTAKTKHGFRWQVETADANEVGGFADALRRMAHEVQQVVVLRITAPDILEALQKS